MLTSTNVYSMSYQIHRTHYIPRLNTVLIRRAVISGELAAVLQHTVDHRKIYLFFIQTKVRENRSKLFIARIQRGCSNDRQTRNANY